MSTPRKRGVAAVWTNTLVYAILVIGALLVLAPFALSVMTSLKTPRQFATSSPLEPPAPPTLDNFTNLFAGGTKRLRRDVRRRDSCPCGPTSFFHHGRLCFRAYQFSWS